MINIIFITDADVKKSLHWLDHHTDVNEIIAHWQKISTCTQKEIWTGINKILNKNSKTRQKMTLIHDNHTIEDSQEILNMFSKFFLHSVQSKLFLHFGDNLSQQGTTSQQSNSKSIFLFPTTETEVYNKIMTLPNKKSTGSDDVPNCILKENANIISSHLVPLINESLESGVFPNTLKTTKIKPLFKKGDPKHTENYRPIALLYAFSKLFEKII